MTQYLEDADAESGVKNGGARRPYVKPFLKNLDVVETEGGKLAVTFEGGSGGFNTPFGPS
jgi:hypothetical protein